MCSGSKFHFASVFRIIIGEGHIFDLQNSIIEQSVQRICAVVIADHFLVIHFGYPLPDTLMP